MLRSFPETTGNEHSLVNHENIYKFVDIVLFDVVYCNMGNKSHIHE